MNSLPLRFSVRSIWSLIAGMLVVTGASAVWAQAGHSAPLADSNAEQAAKNSAASPLTDEYFYRILLSEISAEQNDWELSLSLALDNAKKLGDPRLFERAHALAWQSRSADALLQTVKVWRQNLPQSRDALRANIQLLIALNRLPETVDLIKQDLLLATPKERSAAIGLLPRYFAQVADRTQAASVVEQALEDYWSGKGGASQTAIELAARIAVARLRLQAQNYSGSVQFAIRAQALDAKSLAAAQIAIELLAHVPNAAETLALNYLRETQAPAAEVRMGLARHWIETNRLSEANAMLQALVKGQAQYAEAWLLLGVLQTQLSQLDSASESLSRYLSLSSTQSAQARQFGQTQAFLSLAQIAEKRKDFATAEAWLKRIEDTRSYTTTQLRRASLLMKQGRMDEARNLVQALPDSAEDPSQKVRLELELLRDNKYFAEAYALANRLTQQEPDQLDWLYEKAMLADKMGRPAEMEQLLRQLIQRNPKHAHAHNALGYSFAERNVRLAEAKQLVQKALEIAPNDPFITDSLGWIEFRMGNKAEALRVLHLAYKLRPDAEIAAHLGEVLWSMDQKDGALKIWREGLLTEPDHAVLLETIKRFRAKP